MGKPVMEKLVMEKPAPTDIALNALIRNRWSPRAFADQAVSPEILLSIFEAARWAPSSSNLQPWAYIVATREDRENFSKILGTLVEFNQAWARSAPVLALSIAHANSQPGGSANRHAFHDVGSATAQLTFEANSRRLFVHQMAGFDAKKAHEVFHIPADWEPVAAMAIGYPGDSESLPQPLRDREVAPRTRKPLGEMVMTGSWGQTAPFVSK